LDNEEVRALVARLEERLEAAEAIADPAAQNAVTEALQGLMALYGEGLARMLAIAGGLAGPPRLESFAGDELIAHLLMLHDLHPVDVETRVQEALAEVGPALRSHGGGVQLVGVEEGVARLRLDGNCSGCPSSTETLPQTVEAAVLAAAPDLLGIQAEGAATSTNAASGFVPLTALGGVG
jgi:Fe-S cluster biogenesis protein NfuA